MPGLWVSFIFRKTTFSFEDIAVPEQDALAPWFRIISVGLLSCAFALLMISGGLEVKVGNFDPAKWNQDLVTAALFGFVCGFSEQVLATRVGQQAVKIFDFQRS